MIVIAIVVAGIGVAHALTFPAGTYYFDNNVVKWSVPQIIIESSDGFVTEKLEVTEAVDTRYQFTLSSDIEDVTGYYFSDAILYDDDDDDDDDDDYERTDLLTIDPVAGSAFYPTIVVLANRGGEVERKGYWRSLSSYGLTPSGTLPVLYINTDENEPIISKDNYVEATYYLDPMGIEGIEAIGSAEKPLATQIKGRGNVTWNTFDKKPYRLKLDKKAALLGMKKSKHFVLLSHFDDYYCYARDHMGFEIARRMGMPWTPEHRPIELVLNGDYVGLYWLTEKIRVDEDRVNITEQKDNETDPELITGGWLVEIDNYPADGQVKITEGDGSRLRFTPDTPEELSAEQRAYLTHLVTATDKAIYNKVKSSTEWEKYIDIDALARFYVINEVMDNAEAFSGSCYWNKERGDDTKIVFGPVWDFGNSMIYIKPQGPHFIYDYDTDTFGHHWIKEIAKYPRFRRAVMAQWPRYRDEIYPEINTIIDNYISSIAGAVRVDVERWPKGPSSSFFGMSYSLKSKFKMKYDFLCEQWNKVDIVKGDINDDGSIDSADVAILLEKVLSDGDYDEAADINDDNSIDSADVAILLEIVLAGKE